MMRGKNYIRKYKIKEKQNYISREYYRTAAVSRSQKELQNKHMVKSPSIVIFPISDCYRVCECQ